MTPLYRLFIGILMFALPPSLARAQSDGPTFDQTITWISERLIGTWGGNCLNTVTKADYKDHWLYVTTKGDCGIHVYAINFASLDAGAEARLNAGEGTAAVVTLTANGSRPIQWEKSFDEGSNWSRENIRSMRLNPGNDREFAIKLARAFDHAARLDGGGQKDLF